MRKNLLAFSLSIVLGVPAMAQQPGGGYVTSYDGIDDYIDLGSSAGIGIRTIEFLFSPTNTMDNTTVITDAVALLYRNSASDQDEFGFYFVPVSMSSTDAGKIAFTRYVGSTPITIVTDANSWTGGVWHHIAAVLDGTTGMTMYVDGILQASTHGSVSATTSSNDVTVVGRWGSSSTNYFNGMVDELRFWNAPRSASQIASDLCYVNPSIETTLAGYWRMDEGSGPNTLDASGNGYHGTINGATWVALTPCLSLGMNETPKVEVKLFPNPAKTNLQLSGLNAGSTLTIFDATGKTLQKISVTKPTLLLDVQAWAEGLYLYCVETSDGRGESAGRFCVQR